jgi:hypothetical protein
MPLTLFVQRDLSQPNFMCSHWLVDNQPECVGLELPLMPYVPGGLHAIPAGQYQVTYTKSARFSRLVGHDVFLPLILDLPERTTPTLFNGVPLNDCGIRIHGGNVVNSIPVGRPGGPQSTYNENDPNRTDSDGCLLVGTSFGADGKSLVCSQDALRPLVDKIAAAYAAQQVISLTIS